MSLGVLQHCHYTLSYRVVLCRVRSNTLYLVPSGPVHYCVVWSSTSEYNFCARVNLRVTETLNHSHSTAPLATSTATLQNLIPSHHLTYLPAPNLTTDHHPTSHHEPTTSHHIRSDPAPSIGSFFLVLSPLKLLPLACPGTTGIYIIFFNLEHVGALHVVLSFSIFKKIEHWVHPDFLVWHFSTFCMFVPMVPSSSPNMSTHHFFCRRSLTWMGSKVVTSWKQPRKIK